MCKVVPFPPSPTETPQSTQSTSTPSAISRLDTPTGLRLSGSTLCWNDVRNATRYQVWYYPPGHLPRSATDSSTRQTTTSGGNSSGRSCHNFGASIGPGYFLFVRAEADDHRDSYAARHYIPIPPTLTPTTCVLPPPSSLTISGSTLCWNNVPNAMGYNKFKVDSGIIPRAVDPGTGGGGRSCHDFGSVSPGDILRVQALGDATCNDSAWSHLEVPDSPDRTATPTRTPAAGTPTNTPAATLQPLDAPTNLSYTHSNNNFCWNPVANARGYQVGQSGGYRSPPGPIGERICQNIIGEPGKVLQVRALGDGSTYSHSPWSNLPVPPEPPPTAVPPPPTDVPPPPTAVPPPPTAVPPPPTDVPPQPTKLARPTGLTYSGGQFCWNAVANASNYEVDLPNLPYRAVDPGTGGNRVCRTVNAQPGQLLAVRALGDGANYNHSDWSHFDVPPPPATNTPRPRPTNTPRPRPTNTPRPQPTAVPPTAVPPTERPAILHRFAERKRDGCTDFPGLCSFTRQCTLVCWQGVSPNPSDPNCWNYNCGPWIQVNSNANRNSDE